MFSRAFGRTMSYCLNPSCPNPADQKTPNPTAANFCSNCGTKLLVGDRYRALELLGQGYYSRTFVGRDEYKPSKPPCVIKQTPLVSYSRKGSGAMTSTAQFNQEAMRLEELGRHPQIPSLLAHFTEHQHHYLIQSYYEGLTLRQLVVQHGPFDEHQIRQVLNDSLPILKFIHAQQVIHRNIKPDTLMYTHLTPELTYDAPKEEVHPQLCLIDFEAAKFTQPDSHSTSGTQIGSQHYAPPEQLHGRAMFVSDLYSLGATCLYLLTQKTPTELYDVDNGCWQWRAAQKSPISHELGQVLDKLVARPLGDRYTSADDALHQLNKAISRVGDRPTFIPFLSPPPTAATLAPLPSPDAFASSTNATASAPLLSSETSPPPLSSWTCTHTLTAHKAWVRSVALSADGQLLASGSGDKTVKLWSTQTGKVIHTFAGHDTWVRAVAISPDGKTIASGGNDNNVRLWDVDSGAPKAILNGHRDWVRVVAFSPNGQLLVSAGQDKTIRLWNVNQATEIKQLTGHQHWIVALAISPNGQLVASGSRDRTIRLWDVVTGRCTQVLEGHTAEVLDLAITPDGTRLISGSADQTIKIWDCQMGTLLHTIEDQKHAINTVAVSPEETFIVTGSNDKTVKLWDLVTYDLMETLYGHKGWVWSVAIEQTAQSLPIVASGSWDGVIRLWQPPQ